MRILITGATGYIGKRLLPVLVDRGYEVICCVRDSNRFNTTESQNVKVIEIDFLATTKSMKLGVCVWILKNF